MENPENERFKEAISDANLPQFPDFSEIQQQLRQKAQANLQHRPLQRGPYLVCSTCEYEHTMAYVGPLKRLVGLDDTGGPILKDLVM